MLEWEGINLAPMGHFISYLKAIWMISKAYLYNLVRVDDSSSKTLILELIRVVSSFPEIFPEDIPELPPKREINFGLDLLLETQPISVPSYRMATTELNELKE